MASTTKVAMVHLRSDNCAPTYGGADHRAVVAAAPPPHFIDSPVGEPRREGTTPPC